MEVSSAKEHIPTGERKRKRRRKRTKETLIIYIYLWPLKTSSSAILALWYQVIFSRLLARALLCTSRECPPSHRQLVCGNRITVK
jgi:hypothetical protein